MDAEGRITFNVSGTRYTTKVSLLCQFEDSLLDVLTRQHSDKEIFIDRDATLFAHILNCYRNATIYTAAELGLSERLWMSELAYFGLELDIPNPSKIRPVDDIEKQKRDALLLSLLMWMRSEQPRGLFSFITHPQGMPIAPKGIPQHVYDIDEEFLWTHKDNWCAIAGKHGIRIMAARYLLRVSSVIHLPGSLIIQAMGPIPKDPSVFCLLVSFALLKEMK